MKAGITGLEHTVFTEQKKVVVYNLWLNIAACINYQISTQQAEKLISFFT